MSKSGEDIALTANFEEDVSIKSVVANNVIIYPNPAENELRIRNDETTFGGSQLGIKNVAIFDVYGRNVGVQFSLSFGADVTRKYFVNIN